MRHLLWLEPPTTSPFKAVPAYKEIKLALLVLQRDPRHGQKTSGERYRGGRPGVDHEEARWGGHRIRCSAATGSCLPRWRWRTPRVWKLCRRGDWLPS